MSFSQVQEVCLLEVRVVDIVVLLGLPRAPPGTVLISTQRGPILNDRFPPGLLVLQSYTTCFFPNFRPTTSPQGSANLKNKGTIQAVKMQPSVDHKIRGAPSVCVASAPLVRPTVGPSTWAMAPRSPRGAHDGGSCARRMARVSWSSSRRGTPADGGVGGAENSWESNCSGPTGTGVFK